MLVLICFGTAFAQGSGIKGTVVSRSGKAPVEEAVLTLTLDEKQVAQYKTGQDGTFELSGLDKGRYTLTISAPEFLPAIVNITLEGYMRDLVFVSLTPSQTVKETDDSSFAEFDMDDSGYTDTPTILFNANDVYSNVAGYGFSSIRFKNRGYDSEKQSVYLAGVELNDALTGYSPYSLWSGLNEAMRAKETTIGLETSDYGVGGVAGITSLAAVPSSVRPGWRFSVLSNSALYRLRLMANYASGQLDNGWSYAINASVRAGGNDWVEGVYYRSFALYAGAEKKFNDANRIAFIAFASPGERGAQNASTQEVYDLMGDNMYNSNWGYQNGKVRNSRVRKTFEPVFAIKHDFTPSHNFSSTEIQIRTSGYSKFADKEIPEEVLKGAKTIDVTGILAFYQGSIQITVNSLSDFVVDGKPLE